MAPKLEIRRYTARDVADIDDREMASLGPQLFAIFSESYRGYSLDDFVANLIRRGPSARLMRLYGADGALCGFGVYSLERVRFDGREVLVFDAGSYIRPGYTGAAPLLMRELLSRSLLVRLRHPLTPLHCVMTCASPVSYRLFARNVACVYPHRALPRSEASRELAFRVRTNAGDTCVDRENSIFAYASDVQLVDPDRIASSSSVAGDPDVAYYLKVNPDYLRGNDLAVHLPLTLANIVASAVPPLRGPYRAILTRQASGRFRGAVSADA